MEEESLRAKWDARYLGGARQAPPLEVLAENAHLLPATGEALDLACGLGGSALFLARRGLQTRAWDISVVAISTLERAAAGLPVLGEVRDVLAVPPAADTFDVICVGHFLDRGLCPDLAAALRPGGLLFYQTYVLERVDDTGPGSERFRLGRNELLQLFPDLIVRFYREEGAVGDVSRGFRNRAQMVAQRPG